MGWHYVMLNNSKSVKMPKYGPFGSTLFDTEDENVCYLDCVCPERWIDSYQ